MHSPIIPVVDDPALPSMSAEAQPVSKSPLILPSGLHVPEQPVFVQPVYPGQTPRPLLPCASPGRGAQPPSASFSAVARRLGNSIKASSVSSAAVPPHLLRPTRPNLALIPTVNDEASGHGPETEQQAKVRVLSYTRVDLHRMTFNSHDYVPWYMRPQQPEYKVFHDQDHIAIRYPYVASSMAAHFLSPEVANLGSLDKFSTELIVEILKLVSVKDVFHFRQINRKARRSVQTMLSYERVSLYGLQCVRTMLSTDIAHHYTFEDLYDVLCTPHCVACGKFGDFVYLPTLQRACLNCLLRSRYGEALPFPLFSKARKEFCTVDKERFLDCAELNQKRRDLLEKSLKHVHVTPGRRFISGERGVDVSHTSWFLVNWSESLAALKRISGEGSQHVQLVEQTLMPTATPGSLPLAVVSAPLRLPGHKCAVAASAPMPYFNKTDGRVYRGLSCKGCALDRPEAQRWIGKKRRDTIYAENKFLRHVQACPFAKELWHRSAEGTVSIEHELSAFCKMGGYQNRQ